MNTTLLLLVGLALAVPITCLPYSSHAGHAARGASGGLFGAGGGGFLGPLLGVALLGSLLGGGRNNKGPDGYVMIPQYPQMPYFPQAPIMPKPFIGPAPHFPFHG